VVVLDWTWQDWLDEEKASTGSRPKTPLGSRDTWSTPTVLLGNAGMLLADAWGDIVGGVG
jgi:hypothetical protein